MFAVLFFLAYSQVDLRYHLNPPTFIISNCVAVPILSGISVAFLAKPAKENGNALDRFFAKGNYSPNKGTAANSANPPDEMGGKLNEVKQGGLLPRDTTPLSRFASLPPYSVGGITAQPSFGG